MDLSNEYKREQLLVGKMPPMYDKSFNRFYSKVLYENPLNNSNLVSDFKSTFLNWLAAHHNWKLRGLDSFPERDICIGCTQFIDDLYQTRGQDRIMIMAGDYTYHQRLNSNLKFTSLESLEAGKELLVALPFPSLAEVHPEMDAILNKCLELKIPVHIDGAWISCSRSLDFDFSHPAIHSLAISLSKGLGLGANRIALRFSRAPSNGPISIMNKFDMNCQALLHLGIKFMNHFGPNYLWDKYGNAYQKICQDFELKATNAIHVAKTKEGQLVGLRPLLRQMADV